MDFEFTEQQKKLKERARAFLEREVVPVASEYDRTMSLTTDKVKGLLKRMIPLGYIVGQVPPEYGGLGFDHVTHGILLEEVARAWASLSEIVIAAGTNAFRLYYLGSEEQHRKWLPGLVSADKILCTGNTEPKGGSDAAAYEVNAELVGDHYIINGTKMWSSAGMYADYCLVLAVTGPGKGRKGQSHIFVEKEVSPYEAVPLRLMGARSAGLSLMHFRNCRVPRENRMGHGQEEADAYAYKKQLILWQLVRAHVALQAVGMAQAAIDASLKYLLERHQFGKPIGAFQLMQELLVDMITETDAARLLAYRALSLCEKGMRAAKEVAMAKAYASKVALEVTAKAIEIYGAHGLLEDHNLERYFRDARCYAFPDGTVQINKLIAGREVLGLSAIR